MCSSDSLDSFYGTDGRPTVGETDQSVAAALVGASPRFLLAKDGWLTGVAGLWFLISIRARRPLLFH
ncbi:hypothetical protein ACFQMG_33045, partial [Kitasatospora paranensis]